MKYILGTMYYAIKRLLVDIYEIQGVYRTCRGILLDAGAKSKITTALFTLVVDMVQLGQQYFYSSINHHQWTYSWAQDILTTIFTQMIGLLGM